MLWPAAAASHDGSRLLCLDGPDGGCRRQQQGRYVAEALQHQTRCVGWNLVLTGHSLGGGAAALVALSLLSDHPGKCGNM